jgi:D-aminoacyl-tRNA deacylase
MFSPPHTISWKIISLSQLTEGEIHLRLLVQRVTRASVTIDGKIYSRIAKGLLVLVGIAAVDLPSHSDYLAEKLVNLRIFPDDEGRMNRSALDIRADLLLVSQFTLYGDCRKGRRPSFDGAAPPAMARDLYEYLVQKVHEKGLVTATGVFRAHMEVELVNDGPVTLLLES